MNPSNQTTQESSYNPDKITELTEGELAKGPKPRVSGSVPLSPSEYSAMDTTHPNVARLQKGTRDEIQTLLDSGVSLADALEPPERVDKQAA